MGNDDTPPEVALEVTLRGTGLAARAVEATAWAVLSGWGW